MILKFNNWHIKVICSRFWAKWPFSLYVNTALYEDNKYKVNSNDDIWKITMPTAYLRSLIYDNPGLIYILLIIVVHHLHFFKASQILMSRIIMYDISYIQCVPASKILTMWITLISKDLKAAQKLPETSSLAMLHSTGKVYFCMCSKFNVSNNAIPYVFTIHIQNCLKQEQLYKKRASLYSYFLYFKLLYVVFL